jgi:hypothetical protein
MKFDYPHFDQQKSSNIILKHLKSNTKKAKVLARKRLLLSKHDHLFNTSIAKPDQFVNKFTGDQQLQLHNQRTVNREYNKAKIVNEVYQDFNLSPEKQRAQNQENMNNFYNGHKKPVAGRLFEQRALTEALSNQIIHKQTDQDIYRNEEIRENK